MRPGKWRWKKCHDKKTDQQKFRLKHVRPQSSACQLLARRTPSPPLFFLSVFSSPPFANTSIFVTAGAIFSPTPCNLRGDDSGWLTGRSETSAHFTSRGHPTEMKERQIKGRKSYLVDSISLDSEGRSTEKAGTEVGGRRRWRRETFPPRLLLETFCSLVLATFIPGGFNRVCYWSCHKNQQQNNTCCQNFKYFHICFLKKNPQCRAPVNCCEFVKSLKHCTWVLW